MRASLLLTCLCVAACYRFPIIGKADLGASDLSVGDLSVGNLCVIPPGFDGSMEPQEDLGPPVAPVQVNQAQRGSSANGDLHLQLACPSMQGDLLIAVIIASPSATLMAPPTGWTSANVVSQGACSFFILYSTSLGGETSFDFTTSSTNLNGAVSEWTPGSFVSSHSGPGLTSYSVTAAGELVISAYCQSDKNAAFTTGPRWAQWFTGPIGADGYTVDYRTMAPLGDCTEGVASSSSALFDDSVMATFGPAR